MCMCVCVCVGQVEVDCGGRSVAVFALRHVELVTGLIARKKRQRNTQQPHNLNHT